MAIETELKFIVPWRELARTLRLPWLRRLMAGKPRKERLLSTYFDTARLSLAKRKISLRIRKKDGLTVQTVKGARSDGNGIKRNEWNAIIEGNRPDLDRVKNDGIRKLLKHRRLHKLFQTRVVRTKVSLRVGSARLELASDRGAILASRRRESIHEIELELKRGRTADLFRLGRRLAKAMNASYGLPTKAERGYALISDKPHGPAFAAPIVLEGSLEQVFRTIGFSCLRQIDGNRQGITEGDPEALHQMRVGARRLRIALSLFDGETGPGRALNRELKRLIKALTPARDLDVFVTESLAPVRKVAPHCAGLELLEAMAMRRRYREFSKARSLVTGALYRRFVLDAMFYLADGPHPPGGHHGPKEVAGAALRRRFHLIVAALERLDRLDANGRHKLRISVKKMRYAIRFFESLYTGNRSKAHMEHFVKTLKGLQDGLGGLNDIAVHRQLTRDLVRKSGRPQEMPGLEVMFERDRTRERKLLKWVRRLGRALKRCPAFWEN